MRRFAVHTLHGQGFGHKQRNDNINGELTDVLEQLQVAAAEGREVSVRHLFTLAAANSLLQLVVGQKLPRDGRLQHLIRLVDRNVAALGPAYIHLDLFPGCGTSRPSVPATNSSMTMFKSSSTCFSRCWMSRKPLVTILMTTPHRNT